MSERRREMRLLHEAARDVLTHCHECGAEVDEGASTCWLCGHLTMAGLVRRARKQIVLTAMNLDKLEKVVYVDGVGQSHAIVVRRKARRRMAKFA